MRLPPYACLSYDRLTDERVLRLIQGVPEELWGARLALQVRLLFTYATLPHAGCYLFVQSGKRFRLPRTVLQLVCSAVRQGQSTVCTSRCCLLTCREVRWLRPARLLKHKPACPGSSSCMPCSCWQVAGYLS